MRVKVFDNRLKLINSHVIHLNLISFSNTNLALKNNLFLIVCCKTRIIRSKLKARMYNRKIYKQSQLRIDKSDEILRRNYSCALKKRAIAYRKGRQADFRS